MKKFRNNKNVHYIIVNKTTMKGCLDDSFYDPPETSNNEKRNHSCPLAYGCDDHWTWNTNEKSEDIKLYGHRQRAVRFHPKWSNGTAGVRGTRALNDGRYYWEICVSQRIFGTSMMFGIGTKKSRLHVDGFINMIGEDDQSWGLSHKGYLWHNGNKRLYTKPFEENVPTTIGVYFDGIEGVLTFYKDRVNLGIAFTNLNYIQEPLYPIICSTAAKTEMALGIAKREYFSLQDRCRDVVLQYVSYSNQVFELNLPSKLKEFIIEEYNPMILNCE
ncbi:SPRY domain-containing SOCS box protein 3 [Lepeophtheirus salmonis]|uniref:SPRY domain-containing SOCS box protein 3 n=1 Tax=Lepeophtheirus salmonis TaxID=72036 RepID=UPI001AE7EC9F|nr:SPRY domain-containing SOCS box protein 3-like [Lepeophtheirus salmonis]